MNIQDFVKSVETLNPALADCRKHIAAFGESAKATEEKQKKLAESQKQVTASLQQMKAGFQQMGNAVKESVTSLLSFNGVVGMLGLGIGGKLVDATLHYNRTLFELSQQAKVSGRSFSNMKLAVDEISKSTALAEDHAAQFFKELSDGAQGISITTKMSKELAVAFSTAYGPSLEQMRK